MDLRFLTALGTAVLLPCSFAAASVVPSDLKATPVPNRLGLKLNEYRLSWSAPDQRHYHVLVASDEQRLALGVGDLWDSGRRYSYSTKLYGKPEEKCETLCRGKAFAQGTSVWWKVRMWDRDGKAGDWSEPRKIDVAATPVPRPTATDGKIEFVEVSRSRVVLLGGTAIYEMEKHGHFETALTARWPDHDITFRNLGWPGDDVFGTARGEFQSARGPGMWRPSGNRGAGYGELLSQVRTAKPTSLIVGYGAEAAYAASDEQMKHFEAGYRHLIDDLEGTGATLVLITPIPQLDKNRGAVTDEIPIRNERLRRAETFIKNLAKKRGHTVFDTRKQAIDDSSNHFRNEIGLSDYGHFLFGSNLAGYLGGALRTVVTPDTQNEPRVRGTGMRAESFTNTQDGVRFSLTLDQLPTGSARVVLEEPGYDGGGGGLYHRGKMIGHTSRRIGSGFLEGGPDIEQADRLRQLIIRKNGYQRAKLRPLNKTYIFLFRRHEMGHFAHEMDEYEDLTREAEAQIALMRVPRTHRYEFRGRGRAWTAPREYPDHEVPKEIPVPDLKKELAALKVAEGFQVNLFASNPMVANPINLNWDVRGRAWVSSSSTYPHPRPGEKPNDRIVILEDTDLDGVADKHTVFADGLLVPHSVMPVPGGAYVCSATELLFLEDKDGDDVSESRRVVFSGFGNADVHHMIHGLRWAPWGDLHFIQSIYINTFVDTPHGPRRMNGSGVWRFRPETMRLEPFATGMVNPRGFAFDRWGQSFGTDGAGGQGPHYTFPGVAFRSAVGAHRVLNGLIRGKPNNTGAEFVSGRHVPKHWRGSMLGNDFRANRTVRYELRENGSGYTSKEVETVLHSSHRSFRPVDMKMGPEGAIYIVDWYNAIIDHGEVDFYHPLRDKSHGRIWRITAKDRPLVERPRIAGASIDDLLGMLKAPEDYTRNQAKRELASRPVKEVMPALAEHVKALDPKDPEFEGHRLEALWLQMAHRAGDSTLLQALLHSPSPEVRAAAVRAVSNWDSSGGSIDRLSRLARAVEDPHPQVRLEAVNALRGLGTLDAANYALRALSHPTDNDLNFALELTVRELRDQWLPAMQAGKRVFDGDPARLSYALKEVKDSRAISRLVGLAADGTIGEAELPEALATIAALGEPSDLDKALGMALKNPELLAAIALGAVRNAHVPPDAKKIIDFLKTNYARAAVELVGIWKISDAEEKLVALATSGDADLLGAVCQALGRLGAMDALKKLSAADQPVALRSHAIAAWARIAPADAASQAFWVFAGLKDSAHAELIVDAFLSRDEGPGALATALKKGALEPEVAIACVRRAHASGREVESLIAALNTAGNLKPLASNLTAEQRSELLRDVPKLGDAERGRQVYERKELACTTCHLINNRGGMVGPDLTTVGTYATPESLLESLLNPSTTIKQGYETVIVTKKDNTVVAGLLQRKTGDTTLVRDPSGKVTAIPTNEIAKTDRSPVSLMPPGLTASLRRDELIDLMRYLVTLGK